ncbi:DUF342 domain-containing protein [Falsibacillus albus]|uniref:DUF342 domain-containing protein n=1 Tax=Falsibacillus albus TaxID=2478915 RepID=A0A3L7K5I9_9BACI|nr:FapA family protein [Falsibacillus albus]RLQ98288.1 DUF342 domain-containing protein [Falsibacillus albus]
MKIHHNDYFSIDTINNDVLITVQKTGYPLSAFNNVLMEFPRIALEDFLSLKTAITKADCTQQRIGSLKEEAECWIEEDEMIASIQVNMTEKDYIEKKESIQTKINEMLAAKGVVFGIMEEAIAGLSPMKKIIAAKGKDAVQGSNASISYKERPERKPTITAEGKADYFDMNFLTEVKEGDCLGKKTRPTKGESGKTVIGREIPGPSGKDQEFVYDKKTIELIDEGENSYLIAKVNGVLEFINGKISVGPHLIIEGDVGYETGNIEFDGTVTIKGTVQRGFSVKASKDIAVHGELGISGCDLIESYDGDVFIKGGLFGSGISKVVAAHNIFIKHAHESTMVAGEDIRIGYSGIGCMIIGKNVLADHKKGKIIGGVIEAEGKVISGTIGNKTEMKTNIIVKGFDRSEVISKVKDYRNRQKKAELALKDARNELARAAKTGAHSLHKLISEIADEMEQNNREIKSLLSLLDTKGEGEITAFHGMFPQTYIQIKSARKLIKMMTRGTVYLKEHSLNFL